METNYHKLYSLISDNNTEESLELLRVIYNDYKTLFEKYNQLVGDFGIRYKTIGEDSSYAETYYVFFENEELRDNVYNNYLNDTSYDNVFDCDLMFTKSGLNKHDFQKVFKKENRIYILEN